MQEVATMHDPYALKYVCKVNLIVQANESVKILQILYLSNIC